MLQQLQKTISTLRSDLLMGRYQQASLHYHYINKLFPILQQLNISPTQLSTIKENLTNQMEIASEILTLLEPEQFFQKSEQKNENLTKQQSSEKEVGKWAAKSTKWKKKSTRLEQQKIQPFLPKNEQNQKKIESAHSKIPEVDCEIIQREIVLPLTLPSLFKNKTPSKIIFCPLEQCEALLLLLSDALKTKIEEVKSVEELARKKMKKIDQLCVYVIKWKNKEKGHEQIRKRLEQENCLIVLYNEEIKFIKVQKSF